MNNLQKTDFLLPKNNFWIGIGSVLNLFGGNFEYNYSKTENDADYKALTSDWLNVGKDLSNAQLIFEKENSNKLLGK